MRPCAPWARAGPNWVNSSAGEQSSACRGNANGERRYAGTAARGRWECSGEWGDLRTDQKDTCDCAKVTPMHLPDAHARAPGNYTALSDLV